ncbi:C2H2-type zinc finger transcription factor [Phycomyces blakesleeanus NRRL 1555(-)]|uniref:C2H2-type zinc finger transcription factor n=1 Tax=Phycomyces blakesleeanus (strain ATCC 8743b / DSM 1359 / FGSC 10004 / NBRC 33097 / NRRL 1555) TaxID=763407 RepID=A0A167NPT0_PHYB8|nr:C2H2-type zinc finger transcription factor [Phycomyces blakesleeanus NRRL 1555(-)]OAD76410.1 C2H2-type zinc finger transcription factor [Phycomyces blakesleeanus NRRL 1555(-)]|eukprot:XP_018294450.1 C2H2-type zinc finger transcription factor [Phycomyces blakesleeanus NRRL 1555(-)]
MSNAVDDIERSDKYNAFIQDLMQFHSRKSTRLQTEPVLGGKKIDLLKLYESVLEAGGFDQVTKNRSWKKVGEIFQFPSTCTNSAYILKGLYIRNLLGWEEEKIWRKTWVPPKELFGPEAHKASTLAGKSYKKNSSPTQKPSSHKFTRAYQPIQPDLTYQKVSANHHHHHYQPASQPKPQPQPQQPIDVFALPPGFPALALEGCPSFEQISITDEHSQCSISELHHQKPPPEHIHSTDGMSSGCSAAQQFDNDTRQRILHGLEYGTSVDIEWALNSIVTLSFECPEQLRLDKIPTLLDLLLHCAEPCLVENTFPGTEPNAMDLMSDSLDRCHVDPHKAKSEMARRRILTVVHILRNFSFIENNARILGSSQRLRQMLVRGLVLSSGSYYTHCIDVMENMAPYMLLAGHADEVISCLASLIYGTNRHLLIGALRTLTLLATLPENQLYLIPGSTHIAERVTHLLVVNDEELTGTVLEYLLQYTRMSNIFRLQLLTMHSGADIGIFVSLLMLKSKFFDPITIKDDSSSGSNSPTQSIMSGSPQIETHAHGPCLPPLDEYQQLDEPYRCLGWLKDKFEVADPMTVLSLDDMYLLYEMRFDHEKALKIKDFYTVLKIAFPVASPTISPMANGSGPVLEGTYVRGIQIKMNILQDGPTMMCQWTDCSQSFRNPSLLQSHVIKDHVGSSSKDEEMFGCMWTDCVDSFEDKRDMACHLQEHVSQPTYIDNSDVQGIALVAAHLLRLLSRDNHSHIYFMPYEKELSVAACQRPKLAKFVQTIFSNFSHSIHSSVYMS